MGKKPFIDKKHATTFSLVFANEEEAGLDGSGSDGDFDPASSTAAGGEEVKADIKRVLVPLEVLAQQGSSQDADSGMPRLFPWLSDPNQKPLDEAKRKEILQMGFPDDGYDYSKHLRESRPEQTSLLSANGGAFIPAEQTKRSLAADVKTLDARDADAVGAATEEDDYGGGDFPLPAGARARVRKQVNAESNLHITELEELMEQMEFVEEGEFGDLQDDFLVHASRGAPDAEALARAQARAAEAPGEAARRAEEERQGRHVTSARALMDDCFDQLAEEYGVLDIGDLEEEGEAIAGGGVGLDEFDDVLDEFVEQARGQPYQVEEDAGEGVSSKGVTGEADGVDGDAVRLVGRKGEDLDSGVLEAEGGGVELKAKIKELVSMGESLMDEGSESQEARDKIEIEERYFTARKEENWDCESVLSLRSNLDNHPAKLSSAPRFRQLQEGSAGPGLEPIRLSKNGIPLGYSQGGRLGALEEGDGSEGEEESEEESVRTHLPIGPRDKGETAEQKRERKAAVKAARREARQAKKVTKQHFKEIKIKSAKLETGSNRASVRQM